MYNERLYNFITTEDENTIINSYSVLVKYDPKEHDQSRLDKKSAT
ncbi:37853_t:CDS:2 [Gigaspora margarita]|uniref:37853_t:CDS:1 n=1 Tax=Gigaspora margarita TaxID=4874 RepID=A0ABN7UPN6_GIGMA|nr:37853_t:CDS:2 [Gigaspora margarita]